VKDLTSTAATPGTAGPAGPAAPARSTALTAYVVQSGFGFLLAALGPCLLLLARDLRRPPQELSWVSAGFGVGLLVVGVLGERLARLGPWRLHQLSAAILAVGGVLVAVSVGLEPARTGAILLGLGGAGVAFMSPVILSGPGGTSRMSWAFGLNSLIGIAAGPAMGALDAATGRGRLALLPATLVLLWASLRRPGHPPPPTPGASEHRKLPPGARWRAAWWMAAIVLSVSPEFAFVIWGAARIEASGLSTAAATIAAAAFPIGMSIGRMLVVPKLLGRLPLVPLGVAVAAASTLACAAPLPPPFIVAACATAGLGIAALYPISIGRLVKVPGLDPDRGSAVGAVGSGIAVLFAPLLLGLLAQVVPLRYGFLAATPLLLGVLALHQLARRAGVEPRA
jgi:MFS family permease